MPPVLILSRRDHKIGIDVESEKHAWHMRNSLVVKECSIDVSSGWERSASAGVLPADVTAGATGPTNRAQS